MPKNVNTTEPLVLLPVSLEELKNLSAESFATKIISDKEHAKNWLVCIRQLCYTLEERVNGITQRDARIKTMTDTCNEHENRLQEQGERIQQLVGELNAYRQMNADLLIAKLPADPSPATEPTRRTPTLPDPEKFDGSRDQLRQFLMQLRLKFEMNSDHFANEKQKIAYTASRLTGNALGQILPQIQQDNMGFESAKELIDILTAAFDDPDRSGTARKRLHEIRQRNRDFADYLAEFNRYAPDSQYDDIAKKECLQRGLSEELQALMVHHPVPEKLFDFTALLQSLDARLRSHQQSLRRPPTTSLSPRLPYIRRAATSTISSTTSYNSPASTISPADSASNFPEAMDLSNSRRGPVPPAEKLRRRQLGLCSYCGAAGHQAVKCPLFKCYNCGMVGHASASCTQPKKPRLHELTVDEEEADEQGKA